MTCGFFVACMPTLPRALKGSPLARKIRHCLGVKSAITKTSGAGAVSHSHSHKMSRKAPGDPYLEIDEDGVPMRGLKASESTERLRNGRGNNNMGITRTRHITVERENGAAALLFGKGVNPNPVFLAWSSWRTSGVTNAHLVPSSL